MNIEAYFTPKELKKEIPFTVIQDSDNVWYLYSEFGAKQYKYLLNLSPDGMLIPQEELLPFEESIDIITERLTGLSADLVEVKAQGFENTSDLQIEVRPGYGPDDIYVENKPFSLRQIVELIDNEDIELSPDFQRNFIWDKTRQSKLIESILLGLPLPSIYLSQYEDGRLTVVDGLQRLTTIKLFLSNQLALTNLEYLIDCNGRTYHELEQVLSPLRLRKFGQTQIMCFVIDYRSPSKLKFDLFRRLNTGGKPLNNQEIRNCLSKPDVQKVLKRMTELESFGNATAHSVKDTRMDAREAALRFIHFYEQYSISDPVGDYNGDMEATLDDFIDQLNKRDPVKLEQYITIYDNALKNSYYFFGDYCFRKVFPGYLKNRKSPVNKLLMLTITILLSKYEHSKIIQLNKENCLTDPLADLFLNNVHFFNAMTTGTNGRSNLEKAFASLKKLFQNNIKLA